MDDKGLRDGEGGRRDEIDRVDAAVDEEVAEGAETLSKCEAMGTPQSFGARWPGPEKLSTDDGGNGRSVARVRGT